MKPGTVYYGLLTREGRLAALKHPGFADGWELSGDTELSPFLVEDPEQVGRVLFADTPHYNSQFDRPGWGPFKREDLTPVRVVLNVEAVDIRPPAGVESDKIVDSRDLAWAVVRMHTGVEPDRARRYVGVVLRGVPGDYPDMLGRHVCFGDLHNVRRVDWIGPMPVDWPRAAGDPEGCVMVCSVPKE